MIQRIDKRQFVWMLYFSSSQTSRGKVIQSRSSSEMSTLGSYVKETMYASRNRTR